MFENKNESKIKNVEPHIGKYAVNRVLKVLVINMKIRRFGKQNMDSFNSFFRSKMVEIFMTFDIQTFQ